MNNILIIFDIDGTLLNSVSLHQSAYLKALKSFGFNSINSDWGSYRHHTDSWIFSEVFRLNQGMNPGREILLDFEMRLLEFFSEQAEPLVIPEIPGALDFLSKLQIAGIAFAFATGGMRSVSLEKLKLLGDKSHDIPLVTASEYLERENIVSNAAKMSMDKFGRSFSRVISIGDGIWDAKTAKNLNYEFIGIQKHPEKLSNFCSPQNIFPDFTNLILAELVSAKYSRK